jgi:hypothetical protein
MALVKFVFNNQCAAFTVELLLLLLLLLCNNNYYHGFLDFRLTIKAINELGNVRGSII